MFPIVKTLVFILHALGIPTWFSIFALDQPLIIDETLFRDTANINKFKFTNIAYFFFCLLDYQRADYCFGPLMPIENEAQYDLFVKKLVAWLKELSITFELLRYVPLSEAVFQDCSGPVMHQVMFAFAMAVVKYKIFIGGATLKCSAGTFDKYSYYAYYKIFVNMSTDKNDTNRKAFEADLFQHLLSRTYGQEYSDLILKKSLQQTNDDCTSVNSDKDNAASVASSESGSSIQTQDSILADAVPVQDRSSPSDSTVDPLQYRNQRIRFRIPPHFVQSSPLNEDRVMKPCPVRSIWDLDLRLRYKKPAPIRPRLLKKRSLKVEQRRSAEVNNRGKKREHEDTQDSPFTFTQNKRTMLGAFYEKIIDCLY